MIDRRLERGFLHLLHAGVYTPGHTALTRHARWMAAVLAGGPGAVLSHRSAASLWRFRESSGHAIDVTVPGRRRRHGRGSAHLRALVRDQLISTQVTRHELELRFLEFVQRAGLPRPETNVLIEVRHRRFEVDCLWRRERVIVELDGRSTHDTPSAFDVDRERDRILQAAGWRVARVTWRHLHREANELEADLRLLLRGET